MANKKIFASASKAKPANAINEAGGRAYAFKPEHALAQYAATGTFQGVFYATDGEQLEKTLELAALCDPAFVAKTAVFARQKAYMKDMPAFLAAERAHYTEMLPWVGAILFRGFGVRTAELMSRNLAALRVRPVNYLGGDSPRTALGEAIYTSTDAPPPIKIPLHNELSYATHYPRYLFMACKDPAEEGGQTIIADGRRVFAGVDPEVRELLEAWV